MSGALLLNSGGLDSGMLAAYLSRKSPISSLFIRTGKPNDKECSIAAKITADRYCSDHNEVSVDFGMSSAYVVYEDGSKESADTADQSKGGRLFHCANGWVVHSAIGGAYAQLRNMYEIYGAWKGNIRKDFAKAYNEFRKYQSIEIMRSMLIIPLGDLSTYEEVASFCGVNIEDFSYTHSCGWSKPCGTCRTCVERAKIWQT